MFFMMLLMFCNSIRDSFFYPGYSFCTNISRIFYRSVFLSGCTWLFFFNHCVNKIQYSRFFQWLRVLLCDFYVSFYSCFFIRYFYSFFYSFFLFVFLLFLRCIFVIYRGDLKRIKDFRNQDMFTLQ